MFIKRKSSNLFKKSITLALNNFKTNNKKNVNNEEIVEKVEVIKKSKKTNTGTGSTEQEQ